jgi:hypothetical protein
VIFPFHAYDTGVPIPSLGGNTVRHKPIIPSRIFGPIGNTSCQVLVDTGCDDVILPLAVANRMGIDLTGAPTLHFQGLGGSPIPVQFAPVLLQLISGLSQVVRWRAVVGFGAVAVGRRYWGLFGIAGGLQYFKIWPDIANNQLHLEPMPNLPTTTATVP